MLDIAGSWWTFLLVFVRITAFIMTAPLFSGRQIPGQFKIGLGVVLTILCAGVIDQPVDSLSLGTTVILILKELLAGIVLGLAAQILFQAVQLAGTIIDLHTGFSMANLFDPTFGTSTQLTGSFKNILAILMLLTTNGHHLLIQGVLASFDWVELQALIPAWSDGRIASFFLECLAQMFMIGFMMAAPIVGTLFIVDFALGIVARTVPQMNIFAIMPPVKILIYFCIYILILPSFFYLLNILFETMFESMASILKIMGG
ncbi:flagellar biosynthetic protein FliR [Neobacillus muris]|uniref:flagellar biosynthetic protein FliR n=1 Tax=Neobacillus muris TaxID=2941334 RepID=UPI00204191C7|nr:flagellar biosynthetic protein FliR [Neobacillus muris]